PCMTLNGAYARTESPGMVDSLVVRSLDSPSARKACAVSAPMSVGSTAMLRSWAAPPVRVARSQRAMTMTRTTAAAIALHRREPPRDALLDGAAAARACVPVGVIPPLGVV